MKQEPLRISLFVPVYNEDKILETNIKKLSNVLNKITDEYEIVIVDDTSSDKTPLICNKLNSKKLRYLRYENGPSRRENLGKAMFTSEYDFVGFTDVDLATDISYLETLFFLLKKYDVVLGSRYKGIRPNREFWRLAISRVYNLFMRFYFDSRISDHQCGFKAFRKDKLLKLLKEMRYDTTFKRGWFWDVELLLRAQRAGLNYIEMPVKWVRGENSTFQLKRELKMIGYVLKVKLRLPRKMK